MLIGTALQSGGLSPAHVGYVALHGTGTPLGDPIEVGAIAGALSKRQKGSAPVTLGSVKVSLLRLLLNNHLDFIGSSVNSSQMLFRNDCAKYSLGYC